MARRPRAPKEKSRKKVNVKVLERLHAGKITGPYRIMEKMIEDHHSHLSQAKIAIAWRFGWKADADGRVKLGQCKKGSDLDRELNDKDFVILLNHEAWNRADFTEAQMNALMDHELCFPAGTTIAGPKVDHAFARWYSGQLIKIRTASGYLLSGTPNHPVLTDRGWVPLALLDEGDYVMCCVDPERMAAAVDPDEYQVPADIEKVARSGCVPLGLVPEATHDLDADTSMREVDVVWADSGLRQAINATLPEHAPQFDFGGRRGVAVSFPSSSHLRERFRAVPLPAPSGMSGGCTLLPVADDCEAVLLGVGEVSNLDSDPSQSDLDRGVRHAEALTERLHRLSAGVSLDKVVSVSWGPFNGHVYNLQTRGHWYCADGVIVHNCHAQVSLDSSGELKTDENGRTVYRIRRHDAEEFRDVVARHGMWKSDLQAFAAAALNDLNRPLLTTAAG